jgi:hypothetical protein
VLKWESLPKSIGKSVGESVLFNRKIWWISAIWLLSPCWTFYVSAQDGVKPAVSETTPHVESLAEAAVGSSAVKVEEVRPSVFYLPDKQGNLQAVLDFNYEDFIELYKLKQRLEGRDVRPRYSIQRMTINGVAGDGNAALTVQFQIMLSDSDWIRVPLRLDQALLREPSQYQGPGEHFVHFEGNGEGYVSWIRGKKEGLHEITLKMLVPLSLIGEETKLKLLTPRSTTSELKLKISHSNALGTVSDGATLLPVAAGQEGGTLFTVLGLGGEFQLAWHKAGDRVAEVPAVLEATGNILARMDNQGVTSKATLSIHSYSSPFDRFVVRLPTDAELTPVNTPGYSILPVEGKKEPDSRQSLVEVRLHKKTAGPVEVHLSTRRNFNQEQTSDGFDLAGFEVVSAVRQWGTIAVAAGNDRQIVWGRHRGVRQVDLLPESSRSEGITAGFEYFAFPYTLIAGLAPRKTRINVDPEYVLLVGQDRVELEAKLSCFIRGAKVNVLRMTMPDWEIDEAGPENLVAQDGIDRDENGIVSITLQQPSSGKLELRFRAHKMLEKSAKTLSFALPAPQVLSPGSVIVAIVTADNVELTPDVNSIQGLIRQQIAPPMKLPERRQDAIFYRSEGRNAVFAAAMRVHSRRVTLDAADYVQLEANSAKVTQMFVYSVAYEAVDHLLFDVPQALAGPNRMEIQHNGKTLTAKLINENAEGSVPAGMVRMRVSLPEASIGQLDLTVQYTTSLPPLEISSLTSWSVPLVMPINAEPTDNKLYLTAASGITIVSHGDAWKSPDQDFTQTGRQTRLELQADKSQESLNLEVQREYRGVANTTVVERAWIQTCLTLSARQDRAVFQFTSDQKELLFHIPTGAAVEQMLVMLDGKRVEAQAAGENQFLLALAGDGDIHAYLLELQYHFPGPRPHQGLLSLDFPRLGSNVWTRRMYWQLVLPQNEHVLIDPPGFVGEYYWKWDGYYWGREPLLNQSQLENWIGTSQHMVLPEGAGVYLFGNLGTADRAEIRTVGRTLMVSIASGAALILGLMLIYVPIIRHPFSLLALSLVLLSLTMIYPEPSAMIAQASGLGLALTLMAGLLERSMARRRKKVLFKEPSKVIRDLSSSRIHQQLVPPISASSSTRALPAVPQSLPEEPPQ